MNRASLVRVALMMAAGLCASACNTPGSCSYTAASGLRSCEDFEGDLYDDSIAQGACSTGQGTWSSNTCSRSDLLGTCDVAPADTDHAQNVRYSYYTTAAAGQAAPSAALAKQACGLLGGTFSAP